MRHQARQGGITVALIAMAALMAAPVAAQGPDLAGPVPLNAIYPLESTPPLMPVQSGDVGDLAGPSLSPPSAPAPEPAEPAPDGAAPLRVVPPAPSPEGAGAALGRAVLTVDQEAMYRQSRWGMRAQAEIAAQSRQIAADNDRAFADLVADEDALTAARATLPPEEFRTRAARFDERVTAVREEREAARNALAEMAELDRALFFQAAAPVLGRVMTSRDALVVLDQRTVLIADERIDVTAATIAALNAELGDGREIVAAALAQARAREEAAKKEAEQPAQPPATDSSPSSGPAADPAPPTNEGTALDAPPAGGSALPDPQAAR